MTRRQDDWQSPGSGAEKPEVPVDLKGTTFIVVPAFNEETIVGRVVHDLLQAFPNVVVVDDGSSDGTENAARTAGAMVIRHPINRGQGAALQTGIEFALMKGARFIVTFDADGQHQTADINRLLEPLVRGECEVALGSRFLGEARNLPRSRKWLLRMGVWFTRCVNGLRLTDTHNGLRAFSRAAAERLDIQLDGMAHASEIIDFISRNRLSFREVPVEIHYTDYSLAKGQTTRGIIRVAVQYLLEKVIR